MSRTDTPGPLDGPLDVLRRNRDAARLAAHPFGFDLARAEHGEDVAWASGAPLTAIAGDDTGGTYFLCAGGGVLYADLEGRAGLIAESVADALELCAGLVGWRDCLRLPPGTRESEVTAAARQAEAGVRSSSAPALDADRERLLGALGLTPRPPAELLARLRRALRRTEPDHLLLLVGEGTAHAPLDPFPWPSTAGTVLAACREELARLRADRSAWQRAAFSPVTGPGVPDAGPGVPEHDANAARRAAVLHAARRDRRAADLPLLRYLLEQETRCRRESDFGGMGEELHLAVFLVARFVSEEDLPRLYAARCANFDTWCALSDLPLGLTGRGNGEEPRWEPEALRRWAEALDTPEWFGDHAAEDDAAEDDAETWIDLARRLGLTELARTALIRVLDDAGPADADELPWIVDQFAALGDHRQAVRAQRLHAGLQAAGRSRASARTRLALLEREAGHLRAAADSLAGALADLGGPPGGPGTEAADPSWRDTGLGRDVTGEHLLLAKAAAEAGAADLAGGLLATGTDLFDSLGDPPPVLCRAAHSAALSCGDAALAGRFGDLADQEEQRMADFPYDLEDD
ncbi:hypothetical protein [Streptomyces abyssomicinicus]|uniref:hypothetical protein n=1 Tax=Streptomyces abyssomicinicus TaxID=574929 RepID=UPI0012506BD7|nr:hypothetical protein [Streptomyces abyssomicinicus]